ncbi:MAG: hypothetical protein M0C28_03585 [Candidatus Moduliflexus flocculans]|nr:hypothetical protein [Candidatus Moduliflexus flocculans]
MREERHEKRLPGGGPFGARHRRLDHMREEGRRAGGIGDGARCSLARSARYAGRDRRARAPRPAAALQAVGPGRARLELRPDGRQRRRLQRQVLVRPQGAGRARPGRPRGPGRDLLASTRPRRPTTSSSSISTARRRPGLSLKVSELFDGTRAAVRRPARRVGRRRVLPATCR